MSVANGTMESPQASQPFSWLEPHPMCVVFEAGPEKTVFRLHEDLLAAKSAHFRQLFKDKSSDVERIFRYPDIEPIVFALLQSFLYTGHITTEPEPIPGYDLLIELWKLNDTFGICGLYKDILSGMVEYRTATNTIPSTELLVKVWMETATGSDIRKLLLEWTAEYLRSSDARNEFSKTLPKEVLSELVCLMSELFVVPERFQVSPSPTVGAQPVTPEDTAGEANGTASLDADGDPPIAPAKVAKRRRATVDNTRPSKKPALAHRVSTPASSAKPQKGRRGNANALDESDCTEEEKLEFCKDFMLRMLSGPGFWTRLVFHFKEPVDVVKNEIPDYHEKVSNPMDLGTIKRKLENGEYQTAAEWVADVRLIYENCLTYWGENSEMGATALKFKKSFEDKNRDMVRWISKQRDMDAREAQQRSRA